MHNPCNTSRRAYKDTALRYIFRIRNTLWEQTKAFLEKHRGENGLVEASAVEQYNKMTGEVQALGAAIQKGLIPLLFQFDVL